MRSLAGKALATRKAAKLVKEAEQLPITVTRLPSPSGLRRNLRDLPRICPGRPKLRGYKHKTEGRSLLVYEKGAIWKRELDQGVIAVTLLGALVPTAQSPETVLEVRIVPKGDHYVIEVVYQEEAKQANVDPALFAAVDLGVNVLAALTSNKPGFTPRLVSGKPIKSRNQYYNKQRARHQSTLAKQNRFTSRQLDRITTKRNRRIMYYLHTASRRIIDRYRERGNWPVDCR